MTDKIFVLISINFIDFIYICRLKRKINMNRSSITCPTSEEKINENVSRIAAFFVIAVASLGIYFKSPLVFIALTIDFFLRTFTKGKYSPLKYASQKLSVYFRIPKSTVDAAPKKFAAGMGLVFSMIIAGLLYVQYGLYADVLATVILICAGLEGLKGFCLGCIIYTYIVLPFVSKENSEQSTISINL
jgi:hypothetical protein